jgi:hypothetical protein
MRRRWRMVGGEGGGEGIHMEGREEEERRGAR